MPRRDAFASSCVRALRALVVCLALAVSAACAHAGVMTREHLQSLFPHPLLVGERDAKLPVWPVFKQEATATVLVAWLFESIDLAPLPGFAGVPMNLLVALDAKGAFVDVRVLSQHEPVFLDGLGEAPLHAFVAQYAGLSLTDGIRIGAPGERTAARGTGTGTPATIDGVAKATASVRIVHQGVMAAALQVARARLGFAAGTDPSRASRVREDLPHRALDWDALVRAGLVRHARFTRDEVERAFAGTVGEGQGAGGPDAFADLWIAYLDVPIVGRNVLGDAGWAALRGRLEPGDHAVLVVGTGHSFVGDGFVRGAVPERLALAQGGLPIELRDLDLDAPLALPAALRGADAKVLRVIAQAGLDPGRPASLALRVTRQRGAIFPERVSRDFQAMHALPAEYVVAPPSEPPAWRASWASRGTELAVLALALAALAWGLARPAWLVARPRRLAAFRLAFPAFTLGFVGWWAQGQLSIVNVAALVQAVAAGRSLAFFLYDPVSMVLWAVVLATLVAWGRGTFCGWLCPFGALQEFVHLAARRLGVPRVTLHARWDARAKRLKFAVLAVLLGVAVMSAPWTDRVVEFEPFKTAITLGFARSWPYVAWAVALLAANAVLYKAWCRYLCPLGAGLALLDPLRRLDWIARRTECGQPCQTCRHRCAYQAIDAAGRVHYDECFQCLECVAIHASEARCAPRIGQARGRRVFAIRPVAGPASGVAR